jgi:membrane protein DedA with SNARE-associated domain
LGSKPPLNGYSLIGMGISTAVCVIAGFGGGYWLDEKLKTGVLFTLVGLAVGIAAAAISVRARVKRDL